MKTITIPSKLLKKDALKPLLSVLFALLMTPAFGQTKEMDADTNPLKIPFAIIEKVPVFPGCEDAEDQKACFNEKMMAHIKKYFVYPPEAMKMNIEGRVNVMFTISAEGKIKDLKLRGPHALLENAAREIINKIPPMVSGGQFKGAFVDCPYSFPVNYTLMDAK